MDVYVGVEGYTLPSGFIVKELCVMYTNNEFSHFLFEAPADYYLSDSDKTTILFTTKYLNKLSYYDGDIPYTLLSSILHKLRQYKIYTYGQTSQKLLQGFLPTTIVVNLQSSGFAMSEFLQNPECGRIHPARYCAKAKTLAIQKFIES